MQYQSQYISTGKMSSRTYNQLWIRTQSELQTLIQDENLASNAKPEKVYRDEQGNFSHDEAKESGLVPLLQDREQSYRLVSKLYLQYVKIFRRLEECYDQIVHPQKRLLLRQLLDSTIGRILELKVLACPPPSL